MTIYKFTSYVCFPYKKEETMFYTASSVTQHCPKCSFPILALSFSSYRKSISLVQKLYNYLHGVKSKQFTNCKGRSCAVWMFVEWMHACMQKESDVLRTPS